MSVWQRDFETRGLCTVLLPIGIVYGKGVNEQLGFESCSNKDSTSLPNSVGTERDASGRVWGFFIFYEAIGYKQERLSTGQI